MITFYPTYFTLLRVKKKEKKEKNLAHRIIKTIYKLFILKNY